MVSITSVVFLWYKPCYKNILNYDKNKKAKNLRQYNTLFSMIVEQILDFSCTSLAREGKNLAPNFKRIA